ncbi:MAG: putative GTP-binding protein yptV4 [Streblomastix strix]|uniref:Putative GTP-binding protein yptV4 n=1 Tax=Streblomastix strix TaxID=222440 RepID=A0A5J4VPU5_9EUKA|nr:MAG: putative GTP-binding protein yptV4 [Streblomastix strix]
MSNTMFKLIIVGDVAVGKSCILLQFLERAFVPDHDVTLGVEFGTKILTIDRQTVKLHIWDTAGLETFRSITRSYYRGAVAALLVYDVSRRQTFEGLNEWVSDLQKYGSQDLIVTLVGNKADKQDRQVTTKEGLAFAQEHNFLFFETSAKTGQNVDDTFFDTTRAILRSNGVVPDQSSNSGQVVDVSGNARNSSSDKDKCAC